MENKFLWGVSSSAFQVEGDDINSGKGKSVWDTYCEIPGKIHNGENAKISADHYHRYKEDIALMKELGVNAYRFSISWTRILPNGTGQINNKGIQFYLNLVDELLKNGIEPFITFYHWDLPQALQDKGGLQNKDFPKWFFEYVKVVVDALNGKCNKFITFNEPINCVHSSYYSGVFAPGLTLSEEETFRCLTHLHLAHGLAAKYIRKNVKDSIVSIAISTFEEYPFDSSKECYDATVQKFFTKKLIGESLDAYLDPIFLGKYPDYCYKRFPNVMKEISQDDLIIMSKYTNVICYNNYSGYPIDKNGNEVKIETKYKTCFNTPVDPNGFYWGIKILIDRYHLPLYISENGIGLKDETISKDNKVHDDLRSAYLPLINEKLIKLLEEGFDIRGYFVWSFSDNFEWVSGYEMRFGLVHIDYSNNQKRIKKDSYFVYQKIISETNKKLS